MIVHLTREQKLFILKLNNDKIIFYEYIFIKIKWNFYCRDILISILMICSEGEYGLGTAIAKA